VGKTWILTKYDSRNRRHSDPVSTDIAVWWLLENQHPLPDAKSWKTDDGRETLYRVFGIWAKVRFIPEPEAEVVDVTLLTPSNAIAWFVQNERRIPPALKRTKARKRRLKSSQSRLSKQGQALALLADHPDWTDEKIAEAVGLNRTSLYRMKKFTAARQVLRRGKLERPRGRKDRDGKLEAWKE
jgi:hypothetical protein